MTLGYCTVIMEVLYDVGFLPDIMMLTLCYGTNITIGYCIL